MRTSIQVSFADAEAREIRDSFRSGTCTGNSGRAMITAAEATQLGKRLSEVLLPPVVFNLLAAGLAAALNRQRGGLRVRLVMDPSLIDLPWEYLYRPDRQQAEGVSGFLLYDPAISLDDQPRAAASCSTGSSQMVTKSNAGTMSVARPRGAATPSTMRVRSAS